MKENYVRWTVKDTVFRSLFSEKKYLLELYHVLHPEDTDVTEDDLVYMTLEKVLTNGLYNDLSFRVGNRLLILVEAQSTWSVNIIVRCVMYLTSIWAEYFRETEQSVYSSAPLTLPEPEFYVIYVGNKAVESEITLSGVYFNGKKTDLDVTVHVITENQQSDILNQYILFSKVLTEQIGKYKRTREAIAETLRICQDRNILREYLGKREKEVVDIMVTLFKQEEVWEDYERDIRRTAKAEGLKEGITKGRAEGLEEGMTKGKAEGRAEGLEEGMTKGKAEGRAEGLEEGMTKGKAEGRAEGLEEGITKGKADERNRILRLSRKLTTVGRGDELMNAIKNGDFETIDQLFMEFSI